MVAGSPLADVMDEVDALAPWSRFVAGDPAGDRWVGVDAVVADPAIMGGWVVPDRAALLDDVADDLVTVLAPVFGRLRALVSFGQVGMWGAVADAIADACLERAGEERDDAWAGATALIDRLAQRVPGLRARPTLARVDWSGGVAHFAVRGTCCLYHKVSGCDLDPAGEAYCVSCPTRDPDDRLRRWAAGLDQLAAS